MPVQFTPSPDQVPAGTTPQANPSAKQESGAQTQATAAAPTLDQVRSVVQEVMEQRARAEQSQRDRQEARLNKQIEDLKKALQSSGQELTPEAERQARAALKQSDDPTLPMQSSEGTGRPAQIPTETAQPVSPATPTSTTAPNPITQYAWDLMDGEGIDIDDNDPEAKMIKWDSKQDVHKTVLEAIAAKRRRQANANLPIGGGQPSSRPAHADWSGPQTLDYAFAKLLGNQ